ncbi:MAG: DUF2975 domain-containing protein [Methylococcus sp.]|nr:DUF2975 domain-containing protein [Methylococcus sp.]
MTRSPVASAASRLAHIRRLSRWMGWACLALVVVLPITLMVYWATAEAPELAMQGNLPATALQAPLQAWQRWACAAVTAVPLGMMLMGLRQARRCFVQFADGQIFTAQATAHLRRFAMWVAAAALGAIVSGAITSVLLTLHNPPGMRHLSIGVGSSQVLTLFFAAVVWLMADIIGQGQSLAEENDAFV